MTAQKKTINQWVIEGNNAEFMIRAPRTKGIVLAFRLNGRVRISSLSIEVDEVPAQIAVDWMLAQFENPRWRRRKGYLEHYVEYIFESGCDLKKVGFLEYLLGLGKYQEIMNIVGDSSEVEGVWKLRNRAKLYDILDHPNEIKNMLEKIEIRGYRVAIIKSGMGDILTAGNFFSFMCERFGLNFVGVHKIFDINSKRGYYNETFSDMPLPSTTTKTLFIDVEDIADDFDDLTAIINQVAPGQYDELCLVPKTVMSFSAPLRDSKFICREFLNNQFNRYIKAKVAVKRHTFPEKTVLIHARLGDVAPIPVGNLCLNLFDLRRGNNRDGLVALDSGSKSITLRTLTNIQSLDGFMRYLKGIDSSLRIIFISDGYDLTREMLANPKMQKQITDIIPDLTIQSLVDSINYMDEKIRSLPADQMQVGEKTIEDFFNSVALVISSDVLFSTARGFVFNCVANFKYGDNPQHYFSPATGGHFDVLSTKGCMMHQFTEFTKVQEEVSKCLMDLKRGEQGLVNVSTHCNVYRIVIDQRPQFFNDLANDADLQFLEKVIPRDEETNCLLIDLRAPCKISKLELALENHDVEKSLPFTIDVSVDGIIWSRIFFCDFKREIISIDAAGIITRYIRIEKLGSGSLSFSDCEVFSKAEDFEKYLANPELARRPFRPMDES